MTRYQVQYKTEAGTWVDFGPLHDSMTGAEIYRVAVPRLTEKETRVVPVDSGCDHKEPNPTCHECHLEAYRKFQKRLEEIL